MAGSRGLSIAQQFEAINGSPYYLGTIQSTGTNVVSTLASAIKAGDRLMVQADAQGYVLPSNAGANSPINPSVTNSATTGVKMAADEKLYLCLRDDESGLQWISGSGTTNLKVWRMM